jgi:hypothetical protein
MGLYSARPKLQIADRMNEITGSDDQSDLNHMVVLVQPVGIPAFKPEEACYTATQMGTSSAIILVCSTLEYNTLV